MESVDLTGLVIYDIDGTERIQLNGEYSLNDLASKMIEEWIPFAECRKDCARSDYCKFACGQNEDIRCGIVKSALTNFMEATFELFSNLSFELKQEYLDGAYFLTQYIFDTEIKIGILVSEGFNEFYGRYAPFAFTSLINQREILNNIGRHFKFLPDLNLGKGVLFVEGKTELTFLSEMRKSNMTWFLNLVIKPYDGKDNARPRRIEMLIGDYKKKGYEVYFQGDADGKNHNIFQELINKKLIDPANTFTFRFDFESAVPNEVFFKALTDNRLLKNISLDEYIERASSSPFGIGEESVGEFIAREYGININNYKVPLSKSIAKHYYRSKYLVWWKDDKFMKTDFGRFLRFIMRIPKY